MSLINALKLLDLIILAIISICAVDGSRQVSMRKEPLRAIAFYCIAVGALGVLFDVNRTAGMPWLQLMFHFGIMIYAVVGLYIRKRSAKQEQPRKITAPANLRGRT